MPWRFANDDGAYRHAGEPSGYRCTMPAPTIAAGLPRDFLIQLLFGTATILLIAKALGHGHVLFSIVEFSANSNMACRSLVSGTTGGAFDVSQPAVNFLSQGLLEGLVDPS